jgi:type VI protein secretion system component Hcp
MRFPLHPGPRLFAVLVAAMGLVSPLAAATLQGWLLVDPKVPGESTDAGHPNWLDFEAVSAAGQPPLPGSVITLRRRIDKASPLLFKACATGQLFEKVELHLSQVEEGKPRLFWALTLTNVRVASCTSTGAEGSNGAPVMEDLQLVHEGIRMTYYQLSDPSAPPVTTILPYTGDADGDGMSDEFETQFALLLHSEDGTLDADGDGLSNLEEFQLGTHPRDGSSFFRATAASGPPGSNELTLTWVSVAGASYRIRRSPDLAQPFEVIETVTAAAATTSFTVTQSGPTGFYRIEKVEP